MGRVAGAALLAALAAAPAAAVTMTATWTGIISNSTNIGGGFGLADGVSLDGLAAVMVFVYDPSTPGAVRETTATEDWVSGGTNFGYPSPMSLASVTVNGVTRALDTSQYGNAANSIPAPGETTVYQVSQFYEVSDGPDGQRISFGQLQANAGSYDGAPGFPLDLEAPVPLTAFDPAQFYGYAAFSFNTCFWPVGAGGCLIQESYLFGYIPWDTVKIEAASIPGTVPLPAGLPLLAGALALLGGAARCRRTPVA